ncbi:MAG: ABC transporter permease [Thermodesulfovibrionia bacterium]|nr:ABC transporter permease [Thermodesulfovibrionia bacterium]
MTRLLAVIDRDIKKFRRNPVVVVMSFLMPLLYLVILGNSFQGKLKNLSMAVVNQDSGAYAVRLIENLKAIEAGAKTFTILQLKDQEAAIEGVKSGRYKTALIIPPDFTKRIVLNKSPEVGLFMDNTDSISAETIRNSVSGAVYPIESFPDWLKTFAKINPEAYAVHALKSILFKNAGLKIVAGDILFLLVFTVVMMSIAIITFKRTL